MGGEVLVSVCSGVYAGLLGIPPFAVTKGEGWGTSATCVPCHVPRGTTGLSKHGDPVFLHLCPLNQNPRQDGGGGYAV